MTTSTISAPAAFQRGFVDAAAGNAKNRDLASTPAYQDGRKAGYEAITAALVERYSARPAIERHPAAYMSGSR